MIETKVMRRQATFQEHSLAPHALGAMYRFRADHPMPCHFHGQLEFMVVVSGKAVEQVGNKAFAEEYAREFCECPVTHCV